MKSKINFKTSIYTGSIIATLLLIFGYFTFQKIMKKADNIDTVDLSQLSYQDLDGNKIRLSDFKGKNILINFWATWCAPCVKELPLLNETYDLVKEDFVFIVVSDESKEKIKKFSQQTPYKFVYLKATNKLMLDGIVFVPQTFILDKKGNTKHHHPSIFEGSAEDTANTLYNWVKH